MSWEWQWLWYKYFVAESPSKLFVLACYAESGELIGIAPLRIDKARFSRFARGPRLTFLAGDAGSVGGMFSEYLGFILHEEWEKEAGAVLTQHCLAARDWREAWFDLIPVGSASLRALNSRSDPSSDRYDSPWGEMTSHLVDTPCGGLETYTRDLGVGTRRRVFGSNNKIKQRHGSLRVEFADIQEISNYIDELNRLHEIRWGRAAFAGRVKAFIDEMCRQKARQDELSLSSLILGDIPRSVILNIRAGKIQYNLQLGFDDQFDRGISLGYLHFGVALEAAFADPRIDSFDLLAGGGKNTDYKGSLATRQKRLVTQHLVRGYARRIVYRLRRHKKAVR